MPLPPPDSPRQPLHTRTVRVQSYGRDDGLIDLEAELIDVKGYDFPSNDGGVHVAGDPVHNMHLRITIDLDCTIVAAQAAYDDAPYNAHCSAIAPEYADLVGMNLLKGFRHQVKGRYARSAGCTHMTELSQILPTVAVQTMAKLRRTERRADVKPFQLDGCHALRSDGAVAQVHYPQWYTGTDASLEAIPPISHPS